MTNNEDTGGEVYDFSDYTNNVAEQLPKVEIAYTDEQREKIAMIEKMTGLPIDTLLDYNENIKTSRKAPDNRVCLCGHSVNAHNAFEGVVDCRPSKYQCPCKKLKPVIQVENLRIFIRRTSADTRGHALTLGMLESIKRNFKFEWLIDVACDRCGETDGRIGPCAVSRDGIISYTATGYDAMLCQNCQDQWR